MAYWWVNQNQTWKNEIDGGYLWSLKQKRNGTRNQFYENMQSVRPDDVILSYFNQRIKYVGTASGQAVSAAKPIDFDELGQWDHDGWQVPVKWREVPNPICPRDIIDDLRPLLPTKYSPLAEDGKGLQGVYLTSVPDAMAVLLLGELDSVSAARS